MHKKQLLVVAVAGALAAPMAALAQTATPSPGGYHKDEPAAATAAAPAGGGSSVTISGSLLLSVDNQSISNVYAQVPGRLNTSETRVQDESTTLVFGMRENLGNGLAAVGRLDFRPNIPTGSLALTGESWVGLDSTQWGSITAGRHALHYFKTPEDAYFMGASYRLAPSSLIDFAGGGRVAIANATRTPNTIKWTSPNWSGFQAAVAYSANPAGTGVSPSDLTLGNSSRAGRAWNFNPTYTAGNWAAGWSYWDGKMDNPGGALTAANIAAFQGLGNVGGNVGVYAPGANSALGQLVSADQRSDSLYGHYMFGGWKVGLMWNKSKLTAATTAAGLASVGTELSNRTAWSIPVRYLTGPHGFHVTYTKAQDDSATPVQDGAKQVALTYSYALSKRTYLALSWAKLTNDAAGSYTPYVSTAGVNGGLAPGESTRTIALGVRHNF